jgi:Subtilase family
LWWGGGELVAHSRLLPPQGSSPATLPLRSDTNTFQTNGRMDRVEAVDFISRTAGERPWVLNLSVGSHGGPHDGTTLFEQALDASLAERPGRAACLSVGNYQANRTHAFVQVRQGRSETLAWEIGEADPTPNELEVWYPGRDRLRVAIRCPDGVELADVPLGGRARLIVGGNIVGDVHHRAHDPNNHDNHLDIFLSPGAPPGTWEVVLVGEDVVDGRCGAWVERDAICPGCQSRVGAGQATASSTTGTICNGFRTISVGAYDGHDPERSAAPFSSRGPTRDGREKPSLYAPGVDVLSARSAPQSGDGTARSIRKSGTSMATPHVTGAAALVFEAADRPLEVHETRALLFGTARPATGTDDRWTGAGYLDVEAAVVAARRLAGGAQARPPHEEDEAMSEQATTPGWPPTTSTSIWEPPGPSATWATTSRHRRRTPASD